MRIVMAVTNDLVTDRRVLRHAATLREEGYAVTLFGRNDLHVRSRRSWRFYAEYNLRLCWRLLRTRCDIVWANDTDTLPACWLAARLRGRRLVMDSHELFPEVPELIDRPRVKRVWERIEGLLLPRCDANMTVCQSIADYYRSKYGVEMTVVRNLWSDECGVMSDEGIGNWSDECGVMSDEEIGISNSSFIIHHSTLKMLMYQGAVNKGRGVDWAIDALEFLSDCRLVVAGGGDLLEEMKAYAQSKPWAERIVFTGRLTPEELEPLTRQAAVGLVMLEDMGLSYHFALPNRIGDFVAAGVPIVVSDLPEMAAVVKRFGVGEIIDVDMINVDKLIGSMGKNDLSTYQRINVLALAEAVRKVLAKEWKEEDFAAARADMDWNKEKRKLLECLNA